MVATRFFPAKAVKAVNKLNLDFHWLLIPLGLGLGIAMAYLIVAEKWLVVLGLLAALPVLILLPRYPFLAVIVWLILDPFLMTTTTAPERRMYWIIHRALPPATVGIIVLNHALGLHKQKLPKLGWAEVAMAGYLVASLLSILSQSGDSLATAYRLYDRVFSPMCLYLIVRLAAPGEKDLQRLAAVAFFIAVSQSIIGLLSWSAPHVLPSAWLNKLGERTTGSLVNPSIYTATLVFSALLLLHAALHQKPGLVRTAYLGAFALAAFSVFLSYSRASWLGGILVGLGLLYLYPRFLFRLGLVLAPVLLFFGGVLLANQLSLARERLHSEEAERSALSRLPVALAAYRMLESKPLFGWGYGNFDNYDRRFQGRVANLPNDAKDHASHNVYLTLLAEQGLTGFLLFLAPLAWWLAQSVKRLPGMAAERLGGRKLPILLWLIILNIVVLNNFSNMRVVFGLGLWWITLGLIANSVAAHPAPHRVEVPAGAPQRVPFLAWRPKIAAPESKVRLPQPDLGRPRVGLPAVGAVASFQIREEWTGSAESVS